MPKTITLDTSILAAKLAECRNAGVSYGFGSKAPSLTAKPGTDFTRIDCSGYCLWLLYAASAGALKLVDGSANQHEQIEQMGFERQTVAAGKLHDGRVRIGFLTPEDGGGVGHVLLIDGEGRTNESHGGIGPDSRPFDGTGFQAKLDIFVLTPLQSAPVPAAAPTIRLIIGGVAHIMPASFVNNHVLVSATDLSSALGLPLAYDAPTKTVKIG